VAGRHGAGGELQVTERIEKKLQEVPWVDVLRSQTRPGESLIFVLLKDYTPKKEVPETWYQVRKKIGDMRHTLPQGVLGPFINDEFGDTFITIYALTGDGFDLAALRREADRIGARTAAAAGRQEDRAVRRSGREDLHRGVARQTGDARPQSAGSSSTRCRSRMR
jgi:hypothetical protein